ncbi:MAG: long-chain-fatty-acid--CoA ligase [Pseudomonadota bacterium]|nr:long-chain-fatty-acid--CoA ligase [Pseudomonadota bacterium]MEC8726849.1 long-chain-fatty-acid--CoA ligase [Pseudomonadota bacterium]
MYPAHRILSRAVENFPDRIAFVDGDSRLTYRELGRRVNQLANGLRGLGLNKGDRVAILDWNSHHYAEAYYACALMGLTFMPLNSRLAAPELEHIFNDSDARALLLSEPFLALYNDIKAKAPSLEIFIGIDLSSNHDNIHDYEDLLSKSSDTVEAANAGIDDIIQIYYTSGTTGDPKGVCLTNANIYCCGLDCLATMDFRLGSVWLHSAPMFHLADAVAFWAVPMVGGTQVSVHFDPDKVLQMIEKERVTITSLPATLIALIANHSDLSKYDLSSLTQIMYGGSPTPLGVLQKAEKIFPSNMLLHTYGITETAGLACCLQPQDHDLTVDEDGFFRAASCGPPTSLVDVRVVAANDADIPAGEIGEVVFSGPKIMKEYWRKPEMTAEVLRGGWYHTGDMGFLDKTGHLYLVDRKKDMIISGAENIYSVEVENVISTHPAVKEVAVIGIPHDIWGEQVHAVVVKRAEASELSGDDVIEFCRDKIGGFKIPKSVSFAEGPLPTTGPGKIAKRILRDPYWKDLNRQI